MTLFNGYRLQNGCEEGGRGESTTRDGEGQLLGVKEKSFRF